MEVMYPRCCGLDVQPRAVVACLRRHTNDGQLHREVRTFGTTTAARLILPDELAAHQVTHVAMESAGVYWWPVDHVLEAEFKEAHESRSCWRMDSCVVASARTGRFVTCAT
jgi:transposase